LRECAEGGFDKGLLLHGSTDAATQRESDKGKAWVAARTVQPKRGGWARTLSFGGGEFVEGGGGAKEIHGLKRGLGRSGGSNVGVGVIRRKGHQSSAIKRVRNPKQKSPNNNGEWGDEIEKGGGPKRVGERAVVAALIRGGFAEKRGGGGSGKKKYGRGTRCASVVRLERQKGARTT